MTARLRPRPPAATAGKVVRGYDIIGDVAIVKTGEGWQGRREEIYKSLKAICPHLRLVARRAGDCEGEFRLTPLERIAGSGGFATLHKEYGVSLHVDPSLVYFSPRSGGERFRLAGLVAAGERVLVMFSGIAPLPLMIAAYSDAAEIVGVDKNPHAHRLARINLGVRAKGNTIRLYEGDVAETVPRLRGGFDRIIMPLPVAAADYLGLALRSLRPGGRLHYYDFRKRGDFGGAEETVAAACAGAGRSLVSSAAHACGLVSVRRYRICVDGVID